MPLALLNETLVLVIIRTACTNLRKLPDIGIAWLSNCKGKGAYRCHPSPPASTYTPAQINSYNTFLLECMTCEAGG